MSKKFEIVDGDISDGYHTFGELYEHRCLLFMALCMTNVKECCWKLDEQVEGWFLLYVELPSGQVSYHLPDKYLHIIRNKIRQDQSKIWDGHTSKDVAARLLKAVELG